jgi:hypothetical protein
MCRRLDGLGCLQGEAGSWREEGPCMQTDMLTQLCPEELLNLEDPS